MFFLSVSSFSLASFTNFDRVVGSLLHGFDPLSNEPWTVQAQLERTSMRSVTSGQLRSFLGDVMRMEAGSLGEVLLGGCSRFGVGFWWFWRGLVGYFSVLGGV